jgi:protein arginine N-methyltransferase 1
MIELQRKLLGDKIRNEAFHRALQRVIEKGKTTVVDVGSGTGFLAFLAARLGAKHCTLIEYGDILDTSRTLAKRNGIRNCTFIRKHSMDVKGIPPVDVMVSETLGNYALEENIIETIEDAKRFLVPGGTIIPGIIKQFVCPVITDRLQKEIDVMADVGFDLDFAEAREICLHNIYVKTVKKEDLLAGKDVAKQWDLIDFSKKNASVRTAAVRFEPTSSVTISGLALWWEAELVPGVCLSTSPFEPPTHWEQIYLPLLQAIVVKPGQTLEVVLTSDTRPKTKINLTWEARLLDTAGKPVTSQKLDMRKGFLF